MPDGRIAISEVTTEDWSFAEDVRAYGAADGVEGIGVWREKLAASDDSPAEARERLEGAGLDACSLIYAGGFTDGPLDEQLGDARDAIRTAEILGAPVLLVVAGPRIGVSAAEGSRRARDALEELAPVARDAGVTLALEPIHPIEITGYSTVVTVEQAHEVVAGIDGAALLLDIWNSWWEPDIEQTLAKVGADVAAVQVGDHRAETETPQDRAPPGEGVVPLADLVGTLESTGYDGFYEVELFTDAYDPAEYPELIETCVDGVERVLAAAEP